MLSSNIKRNSISIFLTVAAISLSFNSCMNKESSNKESNTSEIEMDEPKGVNNVAYKWGKMALNATAYATERFTPRPTITSRYLGLIFISVFDAWSRYDDKAIPVYLQNVERRPIEEPNLSNKEIAISYAAYGTMMEYYYSDSVIFKKYSTTLNIFPK